MSAVARSWPVPRSLAGYRASWLGPDLLAGLALAAVAIPEQMATASLAGAPAQIGLLAFVAGTAAIALFGSSRFVSVGADSTIAPVFAGALAMMAAAGSAQYLALAAALALMVGAMLLAAGTLRLGWIADLLSIPVTIGFLAGVAVHIVLSQLPAALGVAGVGGSVVHRIEGLVRAAPGLNGPTLALATTVLGVTALAHRLSPRLPGALAAVVLATGAALALHLPPKGVALLGAAAGGAPIAGAPAVSGDQAVALLPLALLIALICMVQTAATVRGFPDAPAESPDLDRDLVGLGAGNLLAGLAGAFPVDSSPPRTAIVADSGARSQGAGLAALALAAALALFGARLLGLIPRAALSGILIFIAGRIVRIGDMARIAARSPAEALLVIATATAVVLLPIEIGVASGVGLSILHGVWSSARPRTFRMVRLPGTTIWWPDGAGRGERLEGVEVLGFQAPLNFLNADVFRRQVSAALARPGGAPSLVVLEAAGIIDIDFTAGETFKAVIALAAASGAKLAVARLEAVAAQNAFSRLGLAEALGPGRVFASVAEAIDALAPGAAPVRTG